MVGLSISNSIDITGRIYTDIIQEQNILMLSFKGLLLENKAIIL
jgi:hypothetical protein